MPVSSTLQRLLRIRDMQEERHREALESALAELRALEHALAVAQQREKSGRRSMASPAQAAEIPQRLAARVEIEAARRQAAALRSRIAIAEEHAARMRHEYLSKRVERRQAETLVRADQAREMLERARQSQRMLDDWYGAAFHRGAAQSNPQPPVPPLRAPGAPDRDESPQAPDDNRDPGSVTTL